MNKKYALVTGASRGIGRAIAKKLAESGYYVYINCHSSLTQLEELKNEIERNCPNSCFLLPGDVKNPDVVRAMFQTISERTGALDLLVNNAGIAHIGLLMDMTDEEWQNVLQTNLSSVFYCCRACIPAMVSQKSGAIVNISSIWGVSGASCEAAYSASKAGIGGLTQALAKELAPSNVQVNALACGVIDTSMNQQLDETERTALAEEIPAGRFGTPEEVAAAVMSIVNSPAYLTGQIIRIDGGYL